ncbi:hypothetical protein [Treponema sp.]|uniref:hypothetical protein n=1 Tax=Treponema sp. TaxID=166 RepID=UPI00298DD3AE|nr:hypothetical protein [Treponema sp.]MCQ2241708.1 hypothetical protein [Treponema sp.]
MKKTFKNLFNIALAASLLGLASCDIGLGAAVDTTGPSVTIIDPAPRENVMETFTIRGSVKDDTDIGSVTVTCGGIEWRFSDGQWKVKLENESDFRIDNNSVWELLPDGKSANWQIKNIDFSMKTEGDYDIIVTAQDGSGNTSGESRKSRTIVVDKSAPVISISSPVYKENSNDFDSLTDYKDITKIGNFLTNDFTISGTTTDDNTIVYVDVYLVDPIDETVYYQNRLYQDEAYRSVDEAPTSATQIDSLRAWECNVVIGDWTDLKSKYDLGSKNVFKILTKTKDASGNPSRLTSHGYVCLWKDADRPWLDLNLGTSVSTPLSVYAGSSLLGNAYDDSVVAKVFVTISKVSGEILDGYNRKEIYSGTEENNVFYNIPVPEECTKYCIKVEAEDDKGNKATNKAGTKDYLEGYIEVVDKTFPSLEITHKVNGVEKSNGETLFGDESGNFTFVITAKDDTRVSSIKVAYMTSDTDIINYSDKGYDGWKDSNKGTGAIDLKAGKFVELSLPQPTGITENGISKKVYTLSLDVNIFNDLGIDGTVGHRLSNQTFIFRVEDEKNNEGKSNAVTKDYTILGDIEAPSIEFTNIVYGENTFAQDANGKPVNQRGVVYSNGIPAFTSTSSVKVNGRISDDAINAWGLETVKNKWNVHNGDLFKLECNGIVMTPEIKSTPDIIDGKKWYSFSATISNSAMGLNLKGSSLVYKAVLKDFNNNEVTQNYAFLVDTQTLKVEYIYTSKSDGCYGNTEGATDTVIPILIRFNKNLKFSTSANMPTIKLNNGAIVTMSSVTAAGDREFKFEYSVKNGGTDIDKLNVEEFNLNDGVISDSNGPVTEDAVGLINGAIGNSGNNYNTGINLGDKKKITIIKTLPAITNIEVTLDDDYTKTTVTITYSKAVRKGSGDITITQKNVAKVPPVLSESEYRILTLKKPAIADYYEYTTNGASSSFAADLTPKYVLKYEYDANDPTLVGLYKQTNNHILTQNIKSNKVTINTAAGSKVVTVILDKLPCIGAEYDISIPGGFVVDNAGGSSFPAAKYDNTVGGYSSYIFSTSALPLEKPVIRIKKDDTTVAAVTGGFTSTQPMTASVKIDCETPDVDLKYSYDCLLVSEKKYEFTEVKNGFVGFSTTPTPTKDNSLSKGTTVYSDKFDIGTDNRNGLTYKITATATKNSKTTTAYELAQRTTIQINNSSNKLALRTKSNLANEYTNWPGAIITGSDGLNSKRLGLFLRGGDNPIGGNTTAGLATSWSPSDLDKAILFTEEGSDFYIVSWKITKNLYFMPLAGLMDDDTIKNGKYQGPKYTCNAQNRWISSYITYPAQPGYYLVIVNDQDNNVSFEVNDAGKAKMVR